MNSAKRYQRKPYCGKSAWRGKRRWDWEEDRSEYIPDRPTPFERVDLKDAHPQPKERSDARDAEGASEPIDHILELSDVRAHLRVIVQPEERSRNRETKRQRETERERQRERDRERESETERDREGDHRSHLTMSFTPNMKRPVE
jgi:zinc finger CCCH domain-containing protein 13